MKIYCTFDKVSEQYSQPWFAKNDNVAIRNLMIASRRENLPLEDIVLYSIGCYDSEKGFIFDNLKKEDVQLTKTCIPFTEKESK